MPNPSASEQPRGLDATATAAAAEPPVRSAAGEDLVHQCALELAAEIQLSCEGKMVELMRKLSPTQRQDFMTNSSRKFDAILSVAEIKAATQLLPACVTYVSMEGNGSATARNQALPQNQPAAVEQEKRSSLQVTTEQNDANTNDTINSRNQSARRPVTNRKPDSNSGRRHSFPQSEHRNSTRENLKRHTRTIGRDNHALDVSNQTTKSHKPKSPADDLAYRVKFVMHDYDQCKIDIDQALKELLELRDKIHMLEGGKFSEIEKAKVIVFQQIINLLMAKGWSYKYNSARGLVPVHKLSPPHSAETFTDEDVVCTYLKSLSMPTASAAVEVQFGSDSAPIGNASTQELGSSVESIEEMKSEMPSIQVREIVCVAMTAGEGEGANDAADKENRPPPSDSSESSPIVEAFETPIYKRALAPKKQIMPPTKKSRSLSYSNTDNVNTTMAIGNIQAKQPIAVAVGFVRGPEIQVNKMSGDPNDCRATVKPVTETNVAQQSGKVDESNRTKLEIMKRCISSHLTPNGKGIPVEHVYATVCSSMTEPVTREEFTQLLSQLEQDNHLMVDEEVMHVV